MLGKVKKWLGIEGVKLELLIPDEIDENAGLLSGRIRFMSMNPQKVVMIKVAMIERYVRGRGDEKRTDEYQLGETEMNQIIEIPEGEAVEVDFELPFQVVKSEMDELEDRNFFLGGLVKAAKYLRNVKSQYFVEAEAKVEGTALNPFDKQRIEIG
ncbi:MAG: hypothetical protein R3350_06595 [Saprospiraceae bacterium]|nr:hypothetical protein [Saprospiraceae bacterium]